VARSSDPAARAKLLWRLSQIELKQGHPDESLDN